MYVLFPFWRRNISSILLMIWLAKVKQSTRQSSRCNDVSSKSHKLWIILRINSCDDMTVNFCSCLKELRSGLCDLVASCVYFRPQPDPRYILLSLQSSASLSGTGTKWPLSKSLAIKLKSIKYDMMSLTTTTCDDEDYENYVVFGQSRFIHILFCFSLWICFILWFLAQSIQWRLEGCYSKFPERKRSQNQGPGSDTGCPLALIWDIWTTPPKMNRRQRRIKILRKHVQQSQAQIEIHLTFTWLPDHHMTFPWPSPDLT